jgi:hypothetical protein
VHECESARHLFDGRRWGTWEFDATRLVLVYTPTGYEIDLEDMSSSAEMLDWVFQVGRWATPQEMADLVAAFNDIFDPQANLCSGGADCRVNPTEFLRHRIARRSSGNQHWGCEDY